MEKELVFGWVAGNVNGNYAAWSSWKSYGDNTAATDFYNETSKEALTQGLTWFCVESE